MNIYTSNKIDLEYDESKRLYIFTFSDKYGHYIDSVAIDRDDFNDFYDAIIKHKNRK